MFPSEILGQPGIYEFIKEMQLFQDVDKNEYMDLLDKCGVQDIQSAYRQISELGIILEAEERCFLSKKGNQLCWLLHAINGEDLKEVFAQLRRLEPTLLQYEIVKEGMAAAFIDSLATSPFFKRVLICSPWISMNRKTLQKFNFALFNAQNNLPNGKLEIIAIARPLKIRDPNYSQFLEGFEAMAKMGVEIVLNERLHSKLYVRDPGTSGGLSQAIFGSENLTIKRNIELGIRITNDNVIINQLIKYFFDIYLESTPLKEEG